MACEMPVLFNQVCHCVIYCLSLVQLNIKGIQFTVKTVYDITKEWK